MSLEDLFFTKIKKNLEKHSYFLQNKKLLLLVSGGADSVFLTYFICSYIKPENIHVLHINYALRGKASFKEQSFVQNLCDFFKIKNHSFLYPLDKKKNIQFFARNYRYQVAHQLKEKYHLDYILIAHHQDDVVETFFIKLLQKAGLKGLTSFDLSTDCLLRPLLIITKSEILHYLKMKKISYKTDHSNKKNKFLRNFLRNKIFSILDNHLTHWRESFLASKQSLKESLFLINHFLSFFFTYNNKEKNLFFHKQFFTLSTLIQTTLLKHAFGAFFKKKHFSKKEIAAILEKIKKPGEKKLFSINNLFYAYSTGTLYPTKDEILISKKIILNKQQIFNSKKIILKSIKDSLNLKKTITFSLPYFTNFVLLRSKNKGEKICLNKKSNRTTSLKKMFINQKIPKWFRDFTWVIESERKEIIGFFIPLWKEKDLLVKMQWMKEDSLIWIVDQFSKTKNTYKYLLYIDSID